MASVSNFLYCINVQRVPNPQGKGESINAIGITSVLTLDYLPGPFSFSIFFSLLDVDEGTNRIKVVFKDPNGEEIMNSGDLDIPPLPDDVRNTVPKNFTEYQLSMDLRNIVLKKEGEYVAELYYNDSVIAKEPLRVMKKRQ